MQIQTSVPPPSLLHHMPPPSMYSTVPPPSAHFSYPPPMTPMTPVYSALAALVQEAVASEAPGYTYTSSSRFASAISTLKNQAAARYAAAIAY